MTESNGHGFVLLLILNHFSAFETEIHIQCIDILKYLHLQVFVALSSLLYTPCCFLSLINKALNIELQKIPFDGLFHLITQVLDFILNIIYLYLNYQGSVTFSDVQMACFLPCVTFLILPTIIVFGSYQTQCLLSVSVFSHVLLSTVYNLLLG